MAKKHKTIKVVRGDVGPADRCPGRLMGRMWPDPPPAGGPLPRPSHGRKPPAPKAHHARPSGGGCCPMVAAVGAARRGKYRLASRYAQMSVRLIATRFA